MSEQGGKSGRRLLRSTWPYAAVGLAVAVGAAAVLWRVTPASPRTPTVFAGASDRLQRTEIIPTLDTPTESGKNVVWCAAFPLAWKKLQNDLAGGPVRLDEAVAACDRLNAAPDPSGDLPPDAFYAAAGWVNKGILDTIHAEMERRFPEKPRATFPEIVPDSFVAYAYLEAQVRFPLLYEENKEPLDFTDSAGNVARVRSFGITRASSGHHRRLRGQVEVQVKVLYQKRDARGRLAEYALDLCRTSQPNQVVVALVAPRETLGATLAAVESGIASSPGGARPHHLTVSDELLVPVTSWRIKHEFRELQGRSFQNPTLGGRPMDVALLETQFRLDRSGAYVKAEARMHEKGKKGPRRFVLDRPFLVYMKKRGAKRPFFALWVDNAELLVKWDD